MIYIYIFAPLFQTRELLTGNIIQLESRATGGLLRVNNRTGKVDFHGIYGKQGMVRIQ